MVNVNLYLEEDDRKIASFDFPNGILQVGDIIHVNVPIVYHTHVIECLPSPEKYFEQKHLNENGHLNLKELIVKRKYITLDIHRTREDKLTVDYYCEILN